MSSIYFNTVDGRVRLAGSERAYFSRLLSKNVLAILSDLYDGVSGNQMKKHLPDDCYVLKSKDFKRDFETWFMVGGGLNQSTLKIGNDEIDPFLLSLNTGVLAGGEEINLMARLHGQCEIHAYFMPDDFEFFANVIKDGLECKVFREGQGWDDVVNLFERSTTPIVTSYSVTDSFPNPYLCGLEWEDFENLDEGKAFSMCLEAISKGNGGLRVSQKRQLFGNGISAFNFINA